MNDVSNDLIAEWCEYHHTLNNISAQRRVLQLRVLRELEASLDGPIAGVDAHALECWTVQMIEGGYHPHTVLRNLRLVRPFLRAMWQRGAIDADRWLRLQAVRAPRGAYDRKPRPYTSAQIRQFWVELEEHYPWTRDARRDLRTPARGEFWVRRWAAGQSSYRRVYPYARRLQVEAVVALALYGGVRRDEIFNLELEDMRYQSEYVRVVSHKGAEGFAKERIITLNKPLALAIGNWIEFRAQVFAPAHDRPWLCLRGPIATQPMSHTQFGSLIGDVGRGWELHRLRHTFATERYRAGMPVEILQATLGHARIAQTLAYAQINEDRIIAVSHATDEAFLKAVQNGRHPTTTQEVA